MNSIRLVGLATAFILMALGFFETAMRLLNGDGLANALYHAWIVGLGPAGVVAALVAASRAADHTRLAPPRSDRGGDGS